MNLFVFPTDPIDLDSSIATTAPSMEMTLALTGLRTAYDVAGCEGVIETLSLSLRIFYPLLETFDVFLMPEGTYVLNLATRFVKKNIQTATLFFQPERFDALKGKKQQTGNDYFLIPISEDNIVAELDDLFRLLSRDKKLNNPSNPRFAIHRNGMPYFYNATILWNLSKLRASRVELSLVLRAQDNIYHDIATEVDGILFNMFSPSRGVVVKDIPAILKLYMPLSYVLWIATATDIDVKENLLENTKVGTLEQQRETLRNNLVKSIRYLSD